MNEDLIGMIVTCSLGRVGIVSGRKTITFPNGDVKECWIGMGLDGRGLWATGTQSPHHVLAENLAEYVARIESRPSRVMYR